MLSVSEVIMSRSRRWY